MAVSFNGINARGVSISASEAGPTMADFIFRDEWMNAVAGSPIDLDGYAPESANPSGTVLGDSVPTNWVDSGSPTWVLSSGSDMPVISGAGSGASNLVYPVNDVDPSSFTFALSNMNPTPSLGIGFSWTNVPTTDEFVSVFASVLFSPDGFASLQATEDSNGDYFTVQIQYNGVEIVGSQQVFHSLTPGLSYELVVAPDGYAIIEDGSTVIWDDTFSSPLEGDMTPVGLILNVFGAGGSPHTTNVKHLAGGAFTQTDLATLLDEVYGL
jgi:hypothetical protein